MAANLCDYEDYRQESTAIVYEENGRGKIVQTNTGVVNDWMEGQN